MTLAILWPYILSAGGVLGIYIAGRKSWIGWALGLFMQVLWVAFAITTAQYGFIISAVAYGWAYGLNLWKWRGKGEDVPVLEVDRNGVKIPFRGNVAYDVIDKTLVVYINNKEQAQYPDGTWTGVRFK